MTDRVAELEREVERLREELARERRKANTRDLQEMTRPDYKALYERAVQRLSADSASDDPHVRAQRDRVRWGESIAPMMPSEKLQEVRQMLCDALDLVGQGSGADVIQAAIVALDAAAERFRKEELDS